ncbi:Abhydrolase domain-containing protein 2 [Operophtera brumata]|uniref:Abhydrolase domain-containing protein 2 n=1 Tax=Operophtera brumata TaxID=104452 RepID=A0A0L7LIW2_OPEBR|nr:Abhydrolase domain-containing protein 2 [Operophtera brumata]
MLQSCRSASENISLSTNVDVCGHFDKINYNNITTSSGNILTQTGVWTGSMTVNIVANNFDVEKRWFNTKVVPPPAPSHSRPSSSQKESESCRGAESISNDVTVAICPGIGNTSESVYIRTYVHYSQCHGYRCAVLNHIGALNSVPNLLERYSHTKLILVGFSLGGNLITKYLGEDRKRSPNINFRRFYLYIMTDNYRNIITRHKSKLLSPELKNRYSLDEKMIVSAGTLPDLDEAYSRKVHGFETVADLYKWSSSAFYLDKIKTPIIFVNARDDPILAHGGHLGFYEGGLVYANPVNWLDRALVGIAGGLLMAHDKCSYKDKSVDTEYIGSDDEPDLIRSSTIVYRDPFDKTKQTAH